jgi:hypothetical protein
MVQLLDRKGVTTRVVGPEALSTGGIFGLDTTGVDVICIFYLDHHKLAPVRYSVRRLRKKSPNIPIAVCLWGSGDLAPIADAARADATIGTLREIVDFCSGAAMPITTAEILPFQPATR